MLINSQNQTIHTLISSKEILEKTGISRATLNNYIKLGILPRPIVRKPLNGSTTIKKIGYFPATVLDRLETVQIMKKEGYTIDEIANRFREKISADRNKTGRNSEKKQKISGESPKAYFAIKEELSITFEQINYPSYLVNERFEIIWINDEAEQKIFKQRINLLAEGLHRNVFKLFFHWELNSLIMNWKDLITFHLAFAKAKFSREWVTKFYAGISERESTLLGELYDKAPTAIETSISDRQIFFLKKDGTTFIYKVYIIFIREGLLFIYTPQYLLYQEK